jgi:hypothetical protein
MNPYETRNNNPTKSMKTSKKTVLTMLSALALLAGSHRTNAQAVESPLTMTYQGLLSSQANDVGNSTYDMTFTLFATNSGGSPIAGPLTNTAIVVNSNGLFSTMINFGSNVFNGGNCFIEIGVATNGYTSFTLLAPRQPITSTPQSMYALSAGTAGIADGVSASAVINGSSLSVGQSNTLGGGYSTIAGGSSNAAIASYAAVAGGIGNTAGGTGAFAGGGTGNGIGGCAGLDSWIAGGLDNYVGSSYSGIGGGAYNAIECSADYSFVGGGSGNLIQSNATYGTISGGNNSAIQSLANFSSVGGGYNNIIVSLANYATISGGDYNTISTNSYESAIGGGGDNTIQANAFDSSIGGGNNNTIQSGAPYSFIGGGNYNTIQQSVFGSVIDGGYTNIITPDSAGSFSNDIVTDVVADVIGGGAGNLITNASYATISGGSANTVYTNFATIPGGQQAVATNYAQLAYSGGMFANPGDSQYSLYVLRGESTPTNPCTFLYLDGRSLEIALPCNRSCAFTTRIVGRTAGCTNNFYCIFNIQGGADGGWGIVCPAGPQIPICSNLPCSPTATIDVSVPKGCLEVSVCGCTNLDIPDIRWTATVENAEVSY